MTSGRGARRAPAEKREDDPSPRAAGGFPYGVAVGDGQGLAAPTRSQLGTEVVSRLIACCSCACVMVPAVTVWSSWLFSAAWYWLWNCAWDRPLAVASCWTVFPALKSAVSCFAVTPRTWA